MTFVQIIEYQTTRSEEVDQLFADWLSSTEGRRTATHELHAQDRDNASHFVDIVEFPSYEEAMRNNDLPETRSVAERMRSLCTSEPRFVNLEVLRDEAT